MKTQIFRDKNYYEIEKFIKNRYWFSNYFIKILNFIKLKLPRGQALENSTDSEICTYAVGQIVPIDWATLSTPLCTSLYDVIMTSCRKVWYHTFEKLCVSVVDWLGLSHAVCGFAVHKFDHSAETSAHFGQLENSVRGFDASRRSFFRPSVIKSLLYSKKFTFVLMIFFFETIFALDDKWKGGKWPMMEKCAPHIVPTRRIALYNTMISHKISHLTKMSLDCLESRDQMRCAHLLLMIVYEIWRNQIRHDENSFTFENFDLWRW